MKKIAALAILIVILAGCAQSPTSLTRTAIENYIGSDPDARILLSGAYSAYYFEIDENCFFVTGNGERYTRHDMPPIQRPYLEHLEGARFTAISHVNPNLESLYVLDAESAAIEEYHGVSFLWEESLEHVYYILPPSHFSPNGGAPTAIYRDLDPIYVSEEGETVFSIGWDGEELIAYVGPVPDGETEGYGAERKVTVLTR